MTILHSGQPTRVIYQEIDHCCQNFQLLDSWLESQLLRRDETMFLHPAGIDAECEEARASLPM